LVKDYFDIEIIGKTIDDAFVGSRKAIETTICSKS
jgi:hypothetical protein